MSSLSFYNYIIFINIINKIIQQRQIIIVLFIGMIKFLQTSLTAKLLQVENICIKLIDRWNRSDETRDRRHEQLLEQINRITDDLTGEGYCWRKPWGVKRFESMVLSKFILDYSFEQIVKDQLSENEKIGYYVLSNQTFSSMFNAEFSKVGMSFEDMKEEIQNKIKAYITEEYPIWKPWDFEQTPIELKK